MNRLEYQYDQVSKVYNLSTVFHYIISHDPTPQSPSTTTIYNVILMHIHKSTSQELSELLKRYVHAYFIRVLLIHKRTNFKIGCKLKYTLYMYKLQLFSRLLYLYSYLCFDFHLCSKIPSSPQLVCLLLYAGSVLHIRKGERSCVYVPSMTSVSQSTQFVC